MARNLAKSPWYQCAVLPYLETSRDLSKSPVYYENRCSVNEGTFENGSRIARHDDQWTYLGEATRGIDNAQFQRDKLVGSRTKSAST